MVLIVGLTGGIACGKSTVTARIRGSHRQPVVDLDELARRVVEPGRSAHKQIVQHFGTEILLSDGSLDRDALAKRVFSDRSARKAINSATHLPILRELLRDVAAARSSDGNDFVVLDAPLLFESSLHLMCDVCVCVHVSPEVQLERLQARDGLSRDDALARVASQMPVASKMERSDYLIDNESDQRTTHERVDACVTWLRARAEERSLARALRSALLWVACFLLRFF